jgi:MFS family permease
MLEDRSRHLTWYAFLAVLAAMFAITLGYGIAIPPLPFLIEKVAGTNDTATLAWHTGMLTGTYILAVFIFAPLWGKFSDRRGRRPLLLLGLFGFAATEVFFSAADSMTLLYAGRFLGGLFAAAVTPVAYALVGDHAPTKEWRARRFALINIVGTAGFLVGPLLGGLAARASGYLFIVTPEQLPFMPFLAAAGLAFGAAFLVLTLVPSTARPRFNRASAPVTRIQQAITLRLMSVAFVTALAVGAFEVGLSLRGKQVLGLDAAHIGAMFAECSVVMAIVQILVFSPAVRPDLTRWLITPSLLVLSVGLVVVSVVSTSISMTIAVALVAASAGILSPITTYWASLGNLESQGASLGRMTAAASLGQTLGSGVGGLLFDVSFLPGASFTIPALVVFASLLVSFQLPRLLMPEFAYGKHPDVEARKAEKGAVESRR